MKTRHLLFSLLIVSAAYKLSAQDSPNILVGTSPCERYGATGYDMVEWMVQTYSGAGSSYLGQVGNPVGPISDFSKWDAANHRFYRVSGSAGWANEVFEYDAINIYIRRETMSSSPNDYLQHPNYVWLPRIAYTANTAQHQGCATITTSGFANRYQSCSLVSSGGPSFLVSWSGPNALSLGGNLGTVQAIKKTLTNLTNFDQEIYWYAKPYGFVKFQKWLNGSLAVEEIHNIIYPGEPPLLLGCSG